MTRVKELCRFLALALTLFAFGGCVGKYQSSLSEDAATLELVSYSEATLFADDYYADIADYSGGCHASESLGVVISDNNTKSKSVKIPVGKPLKIRANYNHSTYDDITVILTPRKKTHYVVEYVQADRQFYFYRKQGKQKLDIPETDIRMFHVRECL